MKISAFKVFRSAVSVALVMMIVISAFSFVTLNPGINTYAASISHAKTGVELPQGKDVYLIGDFNGWTENDVNWKLNSVNGDGNHYQGDFVLSATSKDYEFKILVNGGYYAKDGAVYGENTQVRGLTKDTKNNDKIHCITSTGTVKISVDLYCEYSKDSQVTIKQQVVSGDVTPGNQGDSIPKGNTKDSKEYTAGAKINNLTPGTDIITVNGSMYDYYMDEEINGNWRTSLTGYYRTVERDNGDLNEANKAAREPYELFNRALAQYSLNNPNWTYPLYFGNFYGKTNGYKGRGVSNLNKFEAAINDSNVSPAGIYGSISSIVDTQLNGNKLSANGVSLPYFDSSWLTENGYGTVINTPFPMRKTVKDGVDYYEFDSNDGKDNCFFTGYETGNYAMNYSNNSNKVKDSLSGYSTEEDGIGFFPFDKSDMHSGEAYDYGFGMRLDINFNLSNNGKTSAAPGAPDTVFNFSGDDDLWVYLDGVLVLDMGGDHKKSSGCINFAKMKSYVNSIDTSYKSDKANALNYVNDSSVSGYAYSADFPALFNAPLNGKSGNSKFNNNDPNVQHTLTVFYMERGMIESNLKVGFNFTPVTDSLKVDVSIDASNVNTKLQNAILSEEEFGYTVSESASKTGTYTPGKNVNSFKLANLENVNYVSKFNVCDYLKIDEASQKTNIGYDTNWVLIDDSLKNSGYSYDSYFISSEDSAKLANFRYINKTDIDKTSTILPTHLALSYVNKPQVVNITVGKIVKDIDGKVITADNTEFDVELLVDLYGKNDYKSYGLTGKISQNSDYIFEGIPVGSSYKIVEYNKNGYTNVSDVESPEGILTKDLSVDFTNRKNSARITLGAKKTLEGSYYYGNKFSFTLSGVKSTTFNGAATIDTSSVSETISSIAEADSGKFNFSELSYEKAGTYLYTIKENSINDTDYQTDKDTVLSVVTVSKAADGELSTSVRNYKGVLTGNNYSSLAESVIPVSNPVFMNSVTDGAVKIVKTDGNSKALEGVTFKLYKVSGDKADISEENLVDTKLSDKDGNAQFTKLDIFKNGKGTKAADGKITTLNASDDDYQWYAVREISTKPGYIKDGVINYFKLPMTDSKTGEKKYEIKMEFVNPPIPSPYAGVIATNIFMIAGAALVILSAIIACAYYLATKKRYAGKRYR